MEKYNVKKNTIPDPRPKRRFIRDLTKEIKEEQKAKELIILGLDVTAIKLPTQESEKPIGISNSVQKFGLINAYEHIYGKVGDTVIKKSHKIDHLLVSPEILPALHRSGFLPWNQVIESDHRTGFVDFDATELLGEEPQDTKNYDSRKLHTKFQKRVEKYKAQVLEKFKGKNIYKAVGKLAKRTKED